MTKEKKTTKKIIKTDSKENKSAALKKTESVKNAKITEKKATKTNTKKKTVSKASETKKDEIKEAVKKEKKTTKTNTKKKTAKKTEAKKDEVKETVKDEVIKIPAEVSLYVEEYIPQPRRSVAFIGSECYPFVKTGGLGDVMYALPKMLAKQNCDVKVILPRYGCIPWEYQEKMVYVGSFDMDLCSDGRSFYVGIMEYVWDGVVYDFIDNQELFAGGNPYTSLIEDIPKFCYFGKAALAALNYLNWVPDVIHCHDWQAGLVPIYLREMFNETPLASAKTILTIHNLTY